MAPFEERAGAAAPTITVSVMLFADLRRRFLPEGAGGSQRYTLAAGATIGDLLSVIGIESGTDLTVALNGELADGADALPDGAEVMLLRPMEGGNSGPLAVI